MIETLRDFERVRDDEAANFCRRLQEHIDQGRGRLIDLLAKPGEEPRRPEVFQQRGGELWTRAYVGVFELEGRRVIIGSRFDKGKEQYFLRLLLETYWQSALLPLDDLDSGLGENFDLLLVIKLAAQLQKAWKKGALRAYQDFAYNDSRMRGHMDVPRHIRENLALPNGRVAYSTRENSLDNDINRLFLLACRAAERRYPGVFRRLKQKLPELQAMLRALEPVCGQGQSVSTVLRRTGKRINNPLYSGYEAARLTARAVLARSGADPTARDPSMPVTGIYLDITQLWEDFLAGTIFRGAAEGNAQQSRDILKRKLTIRPDFYWEEQGMVLDAKYRRAWGEVMDREKWSRDPRKRGEDRYGKDARENVYQVAAYMLALNCREGGVVFPVAGEGGAPKPYDLGPKGRFWLVPVGIPKAAAGYPEFVEKLEKTVQALRECPPVSLLLKIKRGEEETL